MTKTSMGMFAVLDSSSSSKLLLHALFVCSTVMLVQGQVNSLLVFFLPINVVSILCLLFWRGQTTTEIMAQLAVFSMFCWNYKFVEHDFFAITCLGLFAVFITRLVSRAVMPPLGPAFIYIAITATIADHHFKDHEVGIAIVTVAILLLISTLKSRDLNPPSIPSLAILVIYFKLWVIQQQLPFGIVPSLCVAAHYGKRLALRRQFIEPGQLFLSDISIGLALTSFLAIDLKLATSSSFILSALYLSIFRFIVIYVSSSQARAALSATLVFLTFWAISLPSSAIPFSLSVGDATLYLPLFKSFVLLGVSLAAYLVVYRERSPLGLATVQIIATANLAVLVFNLESYRNYWALLNISGFLGFILICASLYTCHRHLKADHGRIWRMAIDDRSMVYLRRAVIATKDGLTSIPIVGGIIAIAIFFLAKIRASFDEKRWTFGHVVMLGVLLLAAYLLNKIILLDMNWLYYDGKSVKGAIDGSVDKRTIYGGIRLFGYALFAILMFFFSKLLNLRYLKELAIVMPLFLVMTALVDDSWNSTALPWPIYIIAILFIILGIQVLSARRRPHIKRVKRTVSGSPLEAHRSKVQTSLREYTRE